MLEPRSSPRVELIPPPGAVLSRGHEADGLEDLEVLGDCRPADRQASGDLDDRERPAAELLEDGAAGAVAQGVEQGIGRGGWIIGASPLTVRAG